MRNDNYFEVYWLNDLEEVIGRLVIQLPKNDSETPGMRVAALTGLSRQITPGEGLRLRTRIHVAAPEGCEPRPLDVYLWSDGTLNNERFVRHLTSMLQGKTPHHFLLHTGMPVLGADMIDRDDKLKELQETLRHSSCHLRAPRRYGKTSLLFRLQEIKKSSVLVDLCDVKTNSGFIAKLLKESLNNETEARSALQSLPELTIWPPPHSPPQTIGLACEDLLSRIKVKISFIGKVFSCLARAGIVLLFDEFSVFLRNMLDGHREEVAPILNLFRRSRIDDAAPLRVVVAGSSGLSSYIQFENLVGFFNDLRPVDLGPISMGAARLLVEELFYGSGKQPSPPVVERVIEHVGDPIPYFLQTLVHETTAQSKTGIKPTVDDVNIAYFDRLLGPLGNIFFRDYLLRERAYPAQLRRGASAILSKLSQASEPQPNSELCRLFKSTFEKVDDSDFSKLMTCLEEDYDLVRSNGNWHIRSKVLRERFRLGEPL